MGEIKSTLDLVMEKTQHLTLSSEEKETQITDDIEKKINGLLQKSADGQLTESERYKHLDQLKATVAGHFERLLMRVVTHRLNLEKDNRYLLSVLASYCRVETAPLEELFAGYHDVRQQEANARIETLRMALAEKFSISGSAVVPNLRIDPQWNARGASIKQDFQKRLEQEIDTMRAETN